ncbi:MAG TPA: hypothetical protein VFB39_02460 [Solirubrobacteraceae bacterium]|nr:hypothetical protein [Solirubrobacteraceae bacterium]
MDPFAVAIAGLLVGLVLVLVLVGRKAPGSGLEQLGWKSERELMERREALEAEDVEQMVAARNARRRARGQREESLEEVEMQVMDDVSEQRRRHEAYLAERDLEQLLEVTNARRRSKGLPERTREDVRREFGPEAGSGPNERP